jgi:hypothetical protein
MFGTSSFGAPSIGFNGRESSRDLTAGVVRSGRRETPRRDPPCCRRQETKEHEVSGSPGTNKPARIVHQQNSMVLRCSNFIFGASLSLASLVDERYLASLSTVCGRAWATFLAGDWGRAEALLRQAHKKRPDNTTFLALFAVAQPSGKMGERHSERQESGCFGSRRTRTHQAC